MQVVVRQCVIGLTACLLGGSIAPFALAKSEAFSVVQDLRYGEALYAYYQEDYISALTQLLKAKKQGGIQGHGSDPVIMEGGFALSFGMEQYASTIFETALSENRDEQTGNAAWMYVAQVQYDQGQYQKALAAAEKISDKTSNYIRTRKNTLSLNSLIRLGELDEAAAAAERLAKKDLISPYVFYNFGAAYASSGQFPLAQQYFSQVPLSENSLTREALYDRTKIAQGYAYLLNEDFAQAVSAFNNVGLLSPLVNRALLGYGWAELGRGNVDTALIPWRRLAKSKVLDTSAQEALLAVPYAYEKLNKINRAIEAYEAAELAYQNEVTQLSGALQKLDAELVRTLIKDQEARVLSDNARSLSGDTRVKLNYARDTDIDPELIYFSELFARDAFQENIQHLRDLFSVERLVDSWQGRVSFYRDEIQRRNETRNSGRYQRLVSKLSAQRDQLQGQYDKLSEEVKGIERNQDWFVLADSGERDLLQRVTPYMQREPAVSLGFDNEKKIYRPSRYIAPSDLNSYQRNILRRSQGLLIWDASEAFTSRLWTMKRELASLKSALGESDKTLGKVIRAQTQAMDLSAYLAGLEQAKQQVDRIQSLSADAESRIVGKLVSQMRNHLGLTLKQMEAYQAQARLSVARLYDLRREESMPSESQALDADSEGSSG